MTRRLFLLFVRSRLTAPLLVMLAAIAVSTAIALILTRDPVSMNILLAAAPLAAGAAIAACTRSPFGDAERVAAAPLPWLRFTHLIGVLAVAIVCLGVASLVEPKPETSLLLLRNGAGAAGLGLLGARWLGAPLAWVPPLALFLIGQIALLAERTSTAWWPWLGWPFAPLASERATLLALAALVAGVVLVTGWGTREPPLEITLTVAISPLSARLGEGVGGARAAGRAPLAARLGEGVGG